MSDDAVPRPQPLGAFPLPAGYLLVPAGDEVVEAARAELVAGRVPAEWPPALRTHRLALAGDRDGALAALDGAAPGAVTAYNRFVLDPDAADADEVRAGLGPLGVLVDVVRFVLGRSDAPPELHGEDAEVAALVLSAQASHALAHDHAGRAVALLDRAADLAAPVSPPLAGMLLGAAAAAGRDGDPDGAVARLTRAVRCLDGADALRVGRAEVHLALAGLLHEAAGERPDLLVRAVPHYHSALQLVTKESAPEVWAAAHADLATAYLTMPMTQASDQLRLGVAAQSLRSALSVWTRDTHPNLWARTQLNLANSLVYTPSKHQADNLAEAVELYEAVLEVRDRGTDPLGRARVLANQGNVLAHLGMFEDAKARLYEARFLFEEAEDEESVRAVRGVLDEVARQRTLLRTGADG